MDRSRDGRDRLYGVLAPARAIAEVEGITLLLVSVELWTSSLLVRFAAELDDRTDHIDREHGEKLQEWARSDRASDPPPPPEHPAYPLTREVRVADDVATRYRPSWRASGGTGAEWRTDVRFTPGVPGDASVLTITVTFPDGAELEVPLELPPWEVGSAPPVPDRSNPPRIVGYDSDGRPTLEEQPMEDWRPGHYGPLDSIGVLDVDPEAFAEQFGWTWQEDEDGLDDELGEDQVVVLFAYAGESRLMLHAALDNPAAGVRLLAGAKEDAAAVRAVFTATFGLPESIFRQ